MKQENLNELRNIYLGLVTGGEGPEVLNESFGPFLSQAEKDNINRKMNQGRAQQPVKAPKAPSSGTELQKALAAPSFGYDPDKGTTEFGTKQKGYTPQILAPLTINGKTTMGAMEPGKRNTWTRARPEPESLKRYNALRDARRFEIEKERLKKVGNKTETAAQIDARVKALNAKKEPPASAGTPTTAPVTQRPAAVTQRPIPTNTSPVTTSTADKIKGGLSNYQSQVKSGDVKGAEETGKSTFALANPKLAAAQAEKDRIRGTSQTDNPLMKDMKDRMPMTPSVQSPTLAKDLGVGTPSSSGNQSLLDNPNASKAAKPTPPTPEIPQATKTTPNINKLKTEPKVEQLNWPSIKTVRDIADAYTDIYEKHNDGNLANNYPPYNKVTRGDVIAGATGNDEMGGNDKMGRKKKKKPSNKKRMNSYLKAINSDFEMWIDGLLNEGYDLSNYTWNEVYEIYENAIVLTEEEYGIYSLVLEHLLSNGYAETEHDANIIIENMSDKWVDVIIDEAYKGGPAFGMKYSKSKPLSGEKGDGSGYGPPEKFTKLDDKIEKPGTTVPPFKKGGYGRIMSNIPHGIGDHRDKTASRITTIIGKDPGAPTSQKMRAPDKKRLSREIVRKKPQA